MADNIKICEIAELSTSMGDKDLLVMDKNSDDVYTTASFRAEQLKEYIFSSNDDRTVTFGTVNGSINAISSDSSHPYTINVPTKEVTETDTTHAASLAYVQNYWADVRDSSPQTVNSTWTFNDTVAITYSGITADRVLLLDSNKKVVTSSNITSTKLEYLSDVTSNIQSQINAKAPSSNPTFTGTITTPISGGYVLVTDSDKRLSASSITTTKLGYLSDVTSGIQSQLNAKADDSDAVHKGSETSNVAETVYGSKTFTSTTYQKADLPEIALIGTGVASNASTPSATKTYNLRFTGNDNSDWVGGISETLNSSGTNSLYIFSRKKINNVNTDSGITMSVDSSGNKSISTPSKVSIGNSSTGSELNVYGDGSQIKSRMTDQDIYTVPSSDNGSAMIVALDKNNKTIGYVNTIHTTGDYIGTTLTAVSRNTADTAEVRASLGVYINRSGTSYTYAPTPAASDNSTKIATTAWAYNHFISSFDPFATPNMRHIHGSVTDWTAPFNGYVIALRYDDDVNYGRNNTIKVGGTTKSWTQTHSGKGYAEKSPYISKGSKITLTSNDNWTAFIFYNSDTLTFDVYDGGTSSTKDYVNWGFTCTAPTRVIINRAENSEYAAYAHVNWTDATERMYIPLYGYGYGCVVSRLAFKGDYVHCHESYAATYRGGFLRFVLKGY